MSKKYLAEKDLDLVATLDAKTAYNGAELVVVAAPPNHDSQKIFDFSSVESVIRLVITSFSVLSF